MKRCFVEDMENVAEQRALEVQNAQQNNQDTVGPKAERSRVEGGVVTAGRPVKKVKAPAETWH